MFSVLNQEDYIMSLSIVVVTETADHEFPGLNEAHAFLHNMGYAQAGEPAIEADDAGSLMTIEYERDQVGMEYDVNSHASLSVFSPREDTVVVRKPGRVDEPTEHIEADDNPHFAEREPGCDDHIGQLEFNF